MIVIYWLEAIVLAYFVYVALYTFFFSLGGLFYKPVKAKPTAVKKKFAILIPAYKEDGVIVDVAKKALEQSYDQDFYDVIIIADSLQKETIRKLQALPIIAFEVAFEKSTKVKALNKTLAHFNGYDHAIILDADNIMDFDFITKMNNLHQQGYVAIQGRRAAKNENNTLSFLDGLSEEINNHIFGRGSTGLGLSASLKGSGMSFDYEKLRILLSEMESVGGFDRELELRFVSEGTKVLYAHDAVIYDEKVEKSQVFENQRKRWISSQFFYLKKYFFSGIINFLKGRMTYFNSAVLRNIQLPRLINLGLIAVFTIIAYIFRDYLPIPYLYWAGTLVVTYVGIALAIPRSYYNIKLAKSLFRLPAIFFKMLLLLFKLKGANKKFIHTPHGSVSK